MLESERYQQSNTIANVHSHFEGVRGVRHWLFELKFFVSRIYYYAVKGFRNSFVFEEKRLPYFYHRYNMTWRSERSVELPIAFSALEHSPGKRILEIGNVLSHYKAMHHDVVDRYEVWPNVLNIDAQDFFPKQPYDFIVSVSTFEHMGHDEEVKDPTKPLRVLRHLLQHCLAKDGKLMVTVPLGHNPTLDHVVSAGNNEGWKLSFLSQAHGAKTNLSVKEFFF